MEAGREVLLLLASLWVFSDALLEIPVFPDADLTKLAGKWYPVMTVNRGRVARPAYACTIKPLAEGAILVTVEIPQKGNCTLQKVSLTTVGPGVFSALGGQVVLMDTDYATYHFTYFAKGDTLSLHLYARQKTALQSVTRKFLGFVKRVGMETEHRFKLRQRDMCRKPPVETQK